MTSCTLNHVKSQLLKINGFSPELLKTVVWGQTVLPDRSLLISVRPNRPNVRFGLVSSAEPLVRSGSVVRQNHWFGEPNR